MKARLGWVPLALVAAAACGDGGSDAGTTGGGATSSTTTTTATTTTTTTTTTSAGGAGGAGGQATGGAGGATSVVCDGDDADLVRPTTWGLASHCPGVTPDYAKVFDDTLVHRVALTMTKADHTATLADLDEKYSGGSTGDLDALPDPMWARVTVAYDGATWGSVGMRYKGHSSLKAAWGSGVRKLSFKLDFDKYEDDAPGLADQRFFGFEKLSFSNAWNDASLVREKVGSWVFRSSGVPAARSTFAAVTLDWGDGPVYLGLYTLVEDPSDAMLAEELDGDGNLYKPWGDAARWLPLAEIPQAEVEAHFEKETHDGDSDWADVLAAIDALHADRTDAAAWRAGLEATFDVPSFLRALAVGQAMTNWDSYGCMHHNYYLYGNPTLDGRLQWIPWDLNESMLVREQGGCRPAGSVMLDEITTGDPDGAIDVRWPLVRFLLADPTYRAAYKGELAAALAGGFAKDAVIAELERTHALVAPFVVGPEAVEKYPYTATSAAEFEASLEGGEHALVTHVNARQDAVKAALAADP